MSRAIVVVEDDESIREMLRYYFQSVGYTVRPYESGEAMFEGETAHSLPVLFILDIMLPGMDGLEILRRLREGRNTAEVPVIMLTARSAEMDRVSGLENGADDYVVKPFDSKEVVARIKAVLRRCNPEESGKDGVIQFANLSLDMSRYELKVKGKVVEAPPKELELLAYLAGHPNRVFTRDQLLDEVWGFEYYGDSRTIDVHIKRLREKLEGASEQWSLKTVWGVGYKFEAKD